MRIAIDALYHYRRIKQPSASLRNMVFAWLSVQNHAWLSTMQKDFRFIFESAEDGSSRRYFLWYRIDHIALQVLSVILVSFAVQGLGTGAGIGTVVLIGFVALCNMAIGWAHAAIVRLTLVLGFAISSISADSSGYLRLIALTIMLFPFVPLFVIPWRSVLRNASPLVRTLVGTFLIQQVLKVGTLLPPLLADILSYGFFTVMLGFTARTVYRFARDRRRAKRLPLENTRKGIEKALGAVAFPSSRLLYLRRIQEARIKPSGEWTSPRHYALCDSEVSEKLTKMDLQWRDLG